MPATTHRKPRRRPQAASADVLGPPLRPPRIPSKWRVHYTRLEELRDRLTGDQGRMTQDARESPPGVAGLHLADAAADHYERDWGLSMLSGEQNARYEIEQAIERIRHGTYGVCELTGKPIQAERLRAIPWTRFRMEGERELEAAGAQPRTRLAGREPAEWAPEAEEPEE